MNSQQRIVELKQQVQRDRQILGANSASWLIPAAALTLGLALPFITRNNSANPLRQVGKFMHRILRFVVIRQVYQFFHHLQDQPQPDTRRTGQ